MVMLHAVIGCGGVASAVYVVVVMVMMSLRCGDAATVCVGGLSGWGGGSDEVSVVWHWFMVVWDLCGTMVLTGCKL